MRDMMSVRAIIGDVRQLQRKGRELFLNGTLATEWWPALEQPTLQKSKLNWDFVNGNFKNNSYATF